MNRQEHLLVILAEEAAEIAQQVSKILRFGIDEQRDFPTSNRERLQGEFNDLLAVVEVLKDDHGIDLHRDPDLIAKKKAKVVKYMVYAEVECGTLDDEQGAPGPWLCCGAPQCRHWGDDT